MILRLEQIAERGTKVNPERGTELLIQRATEYLVIKPEDIPEAYWKQQKQLARDNGAGDINIEGDYKNELINNLQEAQRTGIKSWSNYLMQTGDQYPNWFKMYAWDGMSKLGNFDKKKGVFFKRSKGTVAPFPQLNPAALAKVYDAISQRFAGQKIDDEKLAQLVKVGNFNKLYSKFLLENKAIIPTPENPEDVVGEWIEYGPKEWRELSEAAQGTPWCIAGETTAKSYLNYGDYWNDDDIDDENSITTNSQARFYLFHLYDAETGSLSPTGCASIRLGCDGRVAEVSGLKGGPSQFLEDSLVPTVEAKIETLPGGEKYLQAFADKQKLIAMDKKFQAGELFTIEELEFLYEVYRPIGYVDTYDHDSRPEEFKNYKVLEHMDILKQEYGNEAEIWFSDVKIAKEEVQELLAAGYDANIILSLFEGEINPYLSQLLEAGADVNKLIIPRLDRDHISKYFSQLLEAGADIEELVYRLSDDYIIEHFMQLLEAGAKIDYLASRLDTSLHYANKYIPQILEHGIVNADDLVDLLKKKNFNRGIVEHLPQLLAAGAKIDVDELVSELNKDVIAKHLPQLLAAGAKIDVEQLMQKIGTDYALYLPELHAFGVIADIKDEANRIVSTYNLRYYPSYKILSLIRAGADIDKMLPHLSNQQILYFLPQLLAAGAKIDVEKLIANNQVEDVGNNLIKLLEAGVNADDLVDLLKKKNFNRGIVEHLPQLLAAGAKIDVDELVSELNKDVIAKHLPQLLAAGAKIDADELVSKVDKYYISKNLPQLLAAGAKANAIAQQFSDNEIILSFSQLTAAGADKDLL